MKMTLKKIAFALENEDPIKEETLWALSLGKGLYRLDNSPWFARGCALGDIVRCKRRRNALPLFEKVVERGGNWAVRIFVPSTTLREAVKEEIFVYLKTAGCLFEGYGNDHGLIAVCIPASVAADAVLDQLRRYQSDGKAYWESGNF